MNSLCLFIFIVIQKRVMSEASTKVIIHINMTLGENVTLRLPEREIKGRVKDIMWVRADGNHFATTAPAKNITVRDSSYKGRLSGSTDASLIIINVTAGEQGVYEADVLLSNGDNYYQKYNLTISARSSYKVIRNDHETSMLGACSVSCRGNGRDVTLTCDHTSPQDIRDVYDSGTCTCGPWHADCAPCVLEQYCGKGGVTVLITSDNMAVSVGVSVGVMLVLVLVVSVVICRRRHKREDIRKCLGMSKRNHGMETISPCLFFPDLIQVT